MQHVQIHIIVSSAFSTTYLHAAAASGSFLHDDIALIRMYGGDQYRQVRMDNAYLHGDDEDNVPTSIEIIVA